ncbi:MAG: S41 family peptidase [Prochlorotrichaceae cyanobacterium]
MPRIAKLLIVLLLQLGIFLGGSFTQPALALTAEQKLLNEAWRIVNRAYLDDSFNGQNWWFVRQEALKQSLPTRTATYDAIDSMLASLGDPFTRLLHPDQYKSLQVSTSGELTGVGLQISSDPDTREVIVVTPIPGSPAEAAGIQSGDRILKIDGVETRSLSLEESASRMQGLKGTEVKLEVKPRDRATVEPIVLRRDVITLNPVIAQLKTEADLPTLGYVRLTQFSGQSKSELASSLRSLQEQGAEEFILDLRNNPGGLLQAGIEVARLLINEGAIVYTVNRQGSLGVFQASGEAITDAPLVVLVNQGTASAAEILAGALQENDRATLLGETTFGKGLIQSLFQLSDGAGMAVTVAKYETPQHHDINKLGIQPDRVIPGQPLKLEEVATEADPQYQAALQVLRDRL